MTYADNYHSCNIAYNMVLPAFASLNNLAAFALASVGLAFSLVALLKIGSIACHHMFQALARRWHFGSHFGRHLSGHRS